MEPLRPLAPCFIGSGTIAHPRDMVRALESLESVEFTYEVDGSVISQGEATLVKLMAHPKSATMAVNGCLFLNVASFRYLDFETDDSGRCTVRLFGDGSLLTLSTLPEDEGDLTHSQMRLIDDAQFDHGAFVLAEDDDEGE
ncbi:MAG: hypothetical protein RBS78_07165 [Coriobacteriia bacterium]|jgi:hypothetical protein|nr:hypothetical protein [Coriobacteriia bacterium]